MTEPPAPSAFEQYAPPADTTGGEPQPPTATVPQAPALRLTQQHRSKQDHQCPPHCPVHSRHLLRSPKHHQSLPSTIHSPRSTTWTRTSRHTGCSLQTMRLTQQPQPPQGSPCHQPHALRGLVWWESHHESRQPQAFGLWLGQLGRKLVAQLLAFPRQLSPRQSHSSLP